MALTLNHKQPDRTALDLGATTQTGMNASTLYKLRAALGLEQHPIKIIEPYQMLGEVEPDLAELLEVDGSGIYNYYNMLGYANDDWKPWQMPDGTPVLMGGSFEYETEEGSGNILVFPGRDRHQQPSCVMPAGGSFFDNIERCKSYDEELLDGRKDFKDDFTVADDITAKRWEQDSRFLYENTEFSLVGILGGGSFGDVSIIPGPSVKDPKGVRTVEGWLMAHALYPDYIREIFSYQKEVMLKNLEIYKQAVGDRIQTIWVSGTDLGTQNGTFIAPSQFRELYKPFFKEVNDWIHHNTSWKIFYHTCGCITPLLDDLAEIGVDCLNPVQISAMENMGMTAKKLKAEYGDKFVFWGGGVDTQRVLPFGTPDEVREQTKERVEIFSKGGGFVFSTIHNVVSNVPVENVIAMYETVLGKSLR
jgi:hypothetical protein